MIFEITRFGYFRYDLHRKIEFELLNENGISEIELKHHLDLQLNDQIKRINEFNSINSYRTM